MGSLLGPLADLTSSWNAFFSLPVTLAPFSLSTDFCRRQHGGHSELPDGVAPIGRFTMAGAGTAIMDFGLHPNISPSCFSPQLVPSPLHAEGAGRRRTGKFGKGGSVAPVTKV
jgi:hypothetical protein